MRLSVVIADGKVVFGPELHTVAAEHFKQLDCTSCVAELADLNVLRRKRGPVPQPAQQPVPVQSEAKPAKHNRRT